MVCSLQRATIMVAPSPTALLLVTFLFLSTTIHQSNAFVTLKPNSPPLTIAFAKEVPRRSLLATAAALLPATVTPRRTVAADDFESIASRAAAVSAQITSEENAALAAQEERKSELARQLKDDSRTIYDFELPVSGKSKTTRELVGEGVKAILVVNIKQDDPLARKNIPELIALADR